MRFSSVRIFWIALISLFAMLSSSIASSAPLMTWPMISASTYQSEAEAPFGCVMMDASKISPTMQMNHTSMEISSNHCTSDSPTIHNCCSAACVSVLALLSQTTYTYLQNTNWL